MFAKHTSKQRFFRNILILYHPNKINSEINAEFNTHLCLFTNIYKHTCTYLQPGTADTKTKKKKKITFVLVYIWERKRENRKKSKKGKEKEVSKKERKQVRENYNHLNYIYFNSL